MNTKRLTIGVVAKLSEVNVETIRYYQRRGLLPIPELPTGSVRRYSEDVVRRTRFIKRAQQLGFSLEEIIDLLQLNDGQHCAAARDIAEMKLSQLERKMADLKVMHDSLAGLINACSQSLTDTGCPIINACQY
jgi:MerR family mercuric resistance operon transcriptional regulator